MADDLVVGRIVGEFGIRGELKVAAADLSALSAGAQLVARRLQHGDTDIVVETVRQHGRGNHVIVRFRGIDQAETARTFRGALLLAARASLPMLPEGSYRHADLIGMQVIDARHGVIGTVSAIRRYPSSDMLVVGERQTLVPLLHAYGIKVDLAAHQIFVNLPDGFEELA